MKPSRLALWTALGTAAAGLGVYAWLVEPRWTRVDRRVVPLEGLPQGLEGLRIGLVSDLHLGGPTPTSTVRRAVRKLARERAELVAVTGDLTDAGEELDRALALLAPLEAPLGVYAVPGNHDQEAMDPAAWRAALARHPSPTDLLDRWVVVRRGGARLCVAGVADLAEGEPRLRLPPAGERDFTLLLAHQPDHAERPEVVRGGVDLVLSGHTHGGQVRLPGVGPVVRKSATHDEGLERRGGAPVYTTRGVGETLLPVRLGARPEVVVLELRGARPGVG